MKSESRKYPEEAKLKTIKPSASHVNNGTSVPRENLPWPARLFVPVMKNPKQHIEVEAPVTLWGGLALVISFIRSFNVVERLIDNLQLLEIWLPYSEADHVLAQAYCCRPSPSADFR